MSRHAERGQLLPMWSAAIVTTFLLSFLIINYGNTIRYQMRAQNAADAAAQALMAIQTERFNELTAAIYTANVEEFRTRLLLDGLLLSLDGSGGCTGAPTMEAHGQARFATGTGTCDQVYQNLETPYLRAVNRYTTDVARVNDVATRATYASWLADSASLATHLSSTTNCNTVSTTTVHDDGGDCEFEYHINGQAYRRGENAVSGDAYTIVVPTQDYVLPNNTETENPSFFDPGMIDVVVCAKVPPLIPTFGVLHAATHYVIGRAGATAVLAEEDWFQPGFLIDPVRGSSIQFQPKEVYSTADSGKPYDWYSVNFGGNAWQISSFWNGPANQTNYGYSVYPTVDDMSAYVGWWTAIPYDPRKVDTNAISTATDCPA